MAVEPDPMSEPQAVPSPAERFDASASALRAESTDADALLHALADRLDAVPGLTVVVRHRHGRLRRLIGDLPYVNDLHRRRDPIDRLVVTVESLDYWVTAEDGTVGCGIDDRSRARGTPGDPVPFPEWSDRLFDAIARQNIANAASLAALRAVITGQTT
jgi:hypothetical protein